MPGSLSETFTSKAPIYSANSASSLHSDGSNSEAGSAKKVSFNKAVRVKKYSHPAEKKFWFKVRSASNSPIRSEDKPLSTIIESDSLPSSPMSDRKSGERRIITYEPYYSLNNRSPSPGIISDERIVKKSKKNPLSGVKVMFGITSKVAPTRFPDKEKDKYRHRSYSPSSDEENRHVQHRSRKDDYHRSIEKKSIQQRNGSNENLKSIEKNKKSVNDEDKKANCEKSHDSDVLSERDNSFNRQSKDINEMDMIPVNTWESGPMLVSDSHNKQQSSTYIPGEGRSTTIQEDASKVWTHKTRRIFEEPIKIKTNSPSREKNKIKDQKKDTSPYRRELSPSMLIKTKEKDENDNIIRDDNKHKDNNKFTAEELDKIFLRKEPLFTGHDTDFFPYLDSYLPKMEDKACQCNLKKSKEIKKDFRVIKSNKDGSVSTYSDVPLLTNENETNRIGYARDSSLLRDITHEYDYDHRNGRTSRDPSLDRNEKKCYRSESLRRDRSTDSSYKRSGSLTRESHRSKERNEIHEPLIHKVEAHPLYKSDAIYSRVDKNKKKSGRHENELFDDEFVVTSNPTRYSRTMLPQSTRIEYTKPKKTITTTTRGYNFEFIPGVEAPVVKLPPRPPTPKKELDKYYIPEKSRMKRETIEETMSISNASSDEMVTHTDNEDITGKKLNVSEIEHEKAKIALENEALSHRSIFPKTYERDITNGNGLWFKSGDDYRKGVTEREITYPSSHEGLNNFSTLSRLESRKPSKRDYSPASNRAYTLDRRILDDRRNKRLSSNMSEQGCRIIHHEIDTGSERLAPPIRRFYSNRDLSSDIGDNRRGGLIAAYKARQKRGSSLNRYGPERYGGSFGGSQSQLHRIHMVHSGSESDLGVRRREHESEPVVLYIPSISHHNRRVEDDDRSSGIALARTQSILSSKRTLKKSKKDGKYAIDTGSSINGYNRVNNGYEEDDEIVELRDDGSGKNKKKGLKRSQSIPKDAKLPWLQKLKNKVRSRD